MKKFIQDLNRVEGSFIRKILQANFWIILNYRIGNFFYYKNMFIVSKIFWLINKILYKVDIDPGAKLAGGLRFVHPMCIVIGREVISEGELTIYQGVTLGGSINKTKKHKNILLKQPYLLDKVIIYTSAVVIGPILIGENSLIGANATITKDIPDNSIGFANNIIKSK